MGVGGECLGGLDHRSGHSPLLRREKATPFHGRLAKGVAFRLQAPAMLARFPGGMAARMIKVVWELVPGAGLEPARPQWSADFKSEWKTNKNQLIKYSFVSKEAVGGIFSNQRLVVA
jgi:hypothetical protein